ncbi:MAG TPA: hypothetical protein VMU89_15490 [Thermomicrobiaceae bacterium]|nr:hypothetical protein [Thermomicrobiaceae bacterium]
MSGTATAHARAYLDLPHPTAVALVMAATALFGLLATHGRPDPGRYALLLLAMLAGQIGVGTLNESTATATSTPSATRRSRSRPG